MSTNLPKHLHQILISSSYFDVDHLPNDVKENIRSFQKCYPNSDYKLWTLQKIEDFLVKYFDKSIVECFKTLKPFAYKADLARLCIIYHYGGIYADIGLRFLNPIIPPEDFGIIAFKDTNNGTHYWCAVSNAIIWCKPKRLEIKIAIDTILENCKAKYYGENSLYPTGPVSFGASIIKAMNEHNYAYLNPFEYWIGTIESLFPFTEKWAIIFIDPNRNIIAIRQQSISQLLDENIKTNHYVKIWASKQIYNEVNFCWQCTEPAIQLGEYGLRTTKGIKSKEYLGSGLLSFGPYIDIDKGHYSLAIELICYQSLPQLTISVTSEYGSQILTTKSFPIKTQGYSDIDFVISFDAKSPANSVEFLLTTEGILEYEIVSYTLQKNT